MQQDLVKSIKNSGVLNISRIEGLANPTVISEFYTYLFNIPVTTIIRALNKYETIKYVTIKTKTNAN